MLTITTQIASTGELITFAYDTERAANIGTRSRMDQGDKLINVAGPADEREAYIRYALHNALPHRDFSDVPEIQAQIVKTARDAASGYTDEPPAEALIPGWPLGTLVNVAGWGDGAYKIVGCIPATREVHLAEHRDFVGMTRVDRLNKVNATLADFLPGTKVKVPDRGDEVFVVSGHDQGRNKVEVSYPDAGMLGLYDPNVLVKVADA